MVYNNSPFAKALYESGTPKKRSAAAPDSPKTPLTASSTTSYLTSTATTPSTSWSPSTAGGSPTSTIGGGLRSERSGPNSAPSTPYAFKPSPQVAPTGSWEHPSIKEIRKRSVNKELAVRKCIINSVVAGGLCLLSTIVRRLSFLAALAHSHPLFASRAYYLWVGLVLLCLFNVGSSVVSMLQPVEKFEDLPLTPSQRKLLGLPDSPKSVSPSVSPSPPRYLKSSPQARISPRPSPLSKSAVYGSPLSMSANRRRSMPATPIETPTRPAKATSAGNTTSTTGGATTGTGATVPGAMSGATTGTTTTGSTATGNFTTKTDTTYSPSGRFMYMAESPNNRVSWLNRRV